MTDTATVEAIKIQMQYTIYTDTKLKHIVQSEIEKDKEIYGK